MPSTAGSDNDPDRVSRYRIDGDLDDILRQHENGPQASEHGSAKQPVGASAPQKSESRDTGAEAARYLIAVVVCAGVCFAWITLGVLLFGWKRGGGIIPMLILLSILGWIWRAITKRPS